MSRGTLKVAGLIDAGRIAPMAGVAPSTLAAQKGDNLLPDAGVEFMVDIDLLDDSPFQALIRRVLDPLRVDEIGQSLKSAGQSTAIEVRRKADGRYELIKGHYRKYGAKSTGMHQLRALLVNADDRQAKRDLMLDNEGTKPTEYSYAHMFQSVLDDGECATQSDVADYFGCSQAKVSICLKMLQLPTAVTSRLDKNPALLGATAAQTVQELWAENSPHHDLILAAIDELADGAKQSRLGPIIAQKIADRKRAADKAAGPTSAPKPKPRREVIIGHTGQECYVTILKETGMTVEFKDNTIDRAKAQAAVNKALQDLAAASSENRDAD